MKQLIYLFLFLLISNSNAQESVSYQKPPNEILELVDIQRAPSVLLDDNKEYMVLLYRNAYKTIEELSQEELRLAGLRIDPQTNIGSRVTYYNNIQIKNIKKKNAEIIQVKGLPENPRFTNFTWSPDQKKISLTNTTTNGVEVWVFDLERASLKKLTEANVNANLGDVINWFQDGQSLLVKMISANKKELINSKTVIPIGPTISVNEGKKAQNRTYQDLLKNKYDEYNFEQLSLSEIYKVSLDGSIEKWLGSAIYRSINFSPNGNYIMISTVEKPFSYLVPYRRFPSKTTIYSKDGKQVQTVLEVPLIEDLPKGFMAVRQGKRNFIWRNDKPATLVYSEALDGGDPKNEVEYRDEVFELEEPFNANPKSILKTINRFYNVEWGNNNTAIAHDYWWNNRNMKTYVFNPSDNTQKPRVISDRNYQDRYSDPGNFVTRRNDMARSILALEGETAFLVGDGFSDKGQFPFVDKLNLKSEEKIRIYQSKYTDKKEDLRDFDPNKNELLVRIESPNEYPNYFFRDVNRNKLKQLTYFENPFKSIQNVHKEVINYKRDDGL
jgi:dipeptidyl aminopeptidase/acylaminoacyl peptidase